MFQQDKFLMKLKVTRLDINKKNLTKPSCKKKKLIVKRSKNVSEPKIFEKIKKPKDLWKNLNQLLYKKSQYQKSISKVSAPKSTTSVKYDTQSISGEYKIYYLDITQSLLEKLFNLPQPCGNFPRPLQPCDRKKII